MRSNKKYVVRLTDGEREELGAMVKKGRAAAYKIRHANILLKADADGPAWTDTRIAEAFGCHPRTVENVRRRCVLEGLEGRIGIKPASPNESPCCHTRCARQQLTRATWRVSCHRSAQRRTVLSTS